MEHERDALRGVSASSTTSSARPDGVGENALLGRVDAVGPVVTIGSGTWTSSESSRLVAASEAC